MRYLFLLLFGCVLSVMTLGYSKNAYAISTCGLGGDPVQIHCGIWLCLAGGFPSDCGAQQSKFFQRIAKRHCSPLPTYSSCTGREGGSYETGIERFYPCEEGYELKTYTEDGHSGYWGNNISGRCEYTGRDCRNHDDGYRWGGRSNNRECSYAAQRRSKWRFIEMQVDGQTYPRYYY